VVDLSKIQYLPLNHAAIMNAPVFDNRPCAMVLAVLAANLGAQKHDADSRLAHGRARSLVGTTGVCADPSHANPMTCRDQTPPKSHKSRSVGEVGLVPVTEENSSRDCKLSIFAAHPVRSAWRLGGLNSREPTARKRKQQLRRRPPIRRQEASQRSSQFQESHPIVSLLSLFYSRRERFSSGPDAKAPKNVINMV